MKVEKYGPYREGQKQNAKIGIIGLRYVGLPLAIEFGKAGFFVMVFDIDHQKVKVVREGKSHTSYITRKRT